MCAVFAEHFGAAARNVFYYRRVRKKNENRWKMDVFIAMFQTKEKKGLKLIKQRRGDCKLEMKQEVLNSSNRQFK